jgi:hypothetical protein
MIDVGYDVHILGYCYPSGGDVVTFWPLDAFVNLRNPFLGVVSNWLTLSQIPNFLLDQVYKFDSAQ